MTAVAAGWESGNPAWFAGFPNEVGKSALSTFPRSGFSNPFVHAAASEGAQYRVPLVKIAHAVRAILFASATTVTLR